MTKFIIILLALYAAYYTVNIIYDLFIKKDIVQSIAENEEFSLETFEEENRNNITTVSIEDVENLNTPKSFSSRDVDHEILSDERENMDQWRQRFESEQSIDSFEMNDLLSPVEGQVDQESQNAEIDTATFYPDIAENEQLILKKINSDRWLKMLNLAETNVQLISNNNGHKVYQSSAM